MGMDLVSVPAVCHLHQSGLRGMAVVECHHFDLIRALLLLLGWHLLRRMIHQGVAMNMKNGVVQVGMNGILDHRHLDPVHVVFPVLLLFQCLQ